jgi:hypothetical protein
MQGAIVRGIDEGAKRAMITFRTGRHLPASIPTIGYRDHTDHPWPRILQFVAIITLIYGAARIGLKISEAWFVWDFQNSSRRASLVSELTWAILSLVEILMGLVLIIGAVTLLRSGWQRLILAGQWGVVISWFAALVAGYIMQPAHLTLALAFDAFLQAFYQNILPIMVILVMRAYRQT